MRKLSKLWLRSQSLSLSLPFTRTSRAEPHKVITRIFGTPTHGRVFDSPFWRFAHTFALLGVPFFLCVVTLLIDQVWFLSAIYV